MVEVPAGVALTLLGAIAAYQIALAFGTPGADVAFSRSPQKGETVLSSGCRIASAIAAGLVVLAGWIVAARANLLPAGPLGDGFLTWTTWLIAIYLVVDVAANVAASSVAKRWIGGGGKALAAMMCMLVAIQS